jgi:competence protein ComEA
MKTKRTAIAVAAAAIVATVGALLIAVIYDGNRAPAILIEDAPSHAEIVVSIEGVVSPGVYRLNADARLADAVDAAGGFSQEATVSGLNMAQRLSDEQQIVIPGQSISGATSPAATESGERGDDGLININSADAATLEQLPGIGPVIAQRIVDYRQVHGPFSRVEELARVEGISQAMVQKLKDRITIGP